jgi:hypothetical protein
MIRRAHRCNCILLCSSQRDDFASASWETQEREGRLAAENYKTPQANATEWLSGAKSLKGDTEMCDGKPDSQVGEFSDAVLSIVVELLPRSGQELHEILIQGDILSFVWQVSHEKRTTGVFWVVGQFRFTELTKWREGNLAENVRDKPR